MTLRCQRCAGELVGNGHGRCEYCESVAVLRELVGVVEAFGALKLRFGAELHRARFILRRYDKQYPPLDKQHGSTSK